MNVIHRDASPKKGEEKTTMYEFMQVKGTAQFVLTFSNYPTTNEE